ncbi:MAG: hypothetical protein AB1403_20435 [Candidatus Riflebacteria bacterium]
MIKTVKKINFGLIHAILTGSKKITELGQKLIGVNTLTIFAFLLFYSINHGTLRRILESYSLSLKAQGYSIEIAKSKDKLDAMVASASIQIEELNQKNKLLETWMKASSDDRTALFGLDSLAKETNYKYRQTAAYLAESIRRIDYGFQYLSTQAQWSEFLPKDTVVASLTAETLQVIFNSKCNYKDEIFNFMDLLRNDNKIPELEKRKFYFWLVKHGKSNFAASAGLFLLSRTGNYPAAGNRPINETKILSSEFSDWYKEYYGK